MVIFYLFLLIPTLLFSGEFVASVDRNQIHPGESIILSLTLKDVSSKEVPLTGPLEGKFLIHSTGQSTHREYKNGKLSSTQSWNFILIPQTDSDLEIPSLSIDSSEGILTTQPIKIQIAKPAAGETNNTAETVVLTAEINSSNPYKNQPFIYNVRMTSQQDLVNLKLHDFVVEDAMVEMNKDVNVDEKIIDGVKVNSVEISFIITPLKSGALKIPSLVIQGEMPLKAKSRQNADDDPFSMFRGYHRLKPFVAKTEESVLEVQPAAVDVNPWLPAKALTLEESWDETQPLIEGEPLTRGVRIVAEGLRSSQLLALNTLQGNTKDFKTYADKPESGEVFKDNQIFSTRKDHYTLIPQQSGTLTLPEISLAWWDVAKKEKVIARIPARTLQIIPAAVTKSIVQSAPTEIVQTADTQTVETKNDSWLLGIITALALLLVAAVIWGVTLQKKIGRLTQKPKIVKMIDSDEKYAPPIKKDKKETLPDLNPT